VTAIPPRGLGLTEALLDAKDWHESPVEGERAFEITDADKYMREHARAPRVLVVAPPNV
jgi:hypothetical protein